MKHKALEKGRKDHNDNQLKANSAVKSQNGPSTKKENLKRNNKPTNTASLVQRKAHVKKKRKRFQKSKNQTKEVDSANKTKEPTIPANGTFALYPKEKAAVSSNWKKLFENLKMEKESETPNTPKTTHERNLKSQWRSEPNSSPVTTRKRNRRKKRPIINQDESSALSNVSENGSKVLQKRKNPAVAKNSLSKSPKVDGNASNPVWFDDVDPELLEPSASENAPSESDRKENFLSKPKSSKGLTRAIGMDCEMVGVGRDGVDSILARVSLVNHFGNCIYDKFVKPIEPVTDYRTSVSGCRQQDLENGEEFQTVQKEVYDIMKGRTLVGHALYNDLKVLFLSHPKLHVRDTSAYRPFRALFGGGTPSLKNLSQRLLGVKVQDGEHSSVQDAQAAMRLYTMYKGTWEKEIKQKRHATKARNMNGGILPTSPGATKLAQLNI